MSNILRVPDAVEVMYAPQGAVWLEDDFDWYITAHRWTTVVSDSGTIAGGDAANGILTLTPSDGTVADNDEAYLKASNETFLVAAGKPLYGECRLQFTEINTDDANVAFGFANAVAANLIVDDGAGLRTSGSILAIYKVDGETVWRCVSRNSGASEVTITQSTTTAGGSSYQRLQIEVVDVRGTTATVVFKVDGIHLKDSNNVTIKHEITIASQTEMQPFVGVKNGGANLETVLVDWIVAGQTR